MNDEKYSVIIIDDHPIILNGLSTLLASEKNISITAAIESAKEAEKHLEANKVDIAIIDLSLGDSDGVYLIQRISTKYPNLRILVYSMSEERLFAERLAAVGVSGYVMKTANPSILKQAIQTILSGGVHFSEDIEERIIAQRNGRSKGPQTLVDLLSNREMGVFRLIGQGLGATDISNQLNISRNTVDTHRINIKNKLSLKNSKEVDRYAYETITLGRMIPRKK